MSQVFYSKSHNGFIPVGWKYDGTYPDGKWPDDAVECTQSEEDTYWKVEPPNGFMLGGTDDGRPKWVAIPPPKPEEVVIINTRIRDSLLNNARLIITPLQYAVDLDDATADDVATLKLWKQYSVAVNRTDLTVVKPAWPTTPKKPS